MNDGLSQVCMLEPLVKAVMVPVGQLCSALVPLCVLNNVSAPEEENGNVPDEECNYSQVAQEVSNPVQFSADVITTMICSKRACYL